MSTRDYDQPQTISIPSLLLLFALLALTIRYFFFSKPSSSSSGNLHASRTANQANRANPADVEQIATMFPQLGRREIMWDLQRNGGSVAATTERVLGGMGLDVPPPSFQPPIPPSTTPSTANPSGSQQTSPTPEHVDLITRYNLAGKIGAPSAEEEGDSEGEKNRQTWSNNRIERQALFQRRREEMVLNARRKLEERERKGKGKESEGRI